MGILETQLEEIQQEFLIELLKNLRASIVESLQEFPKEYANPAVIELLLDFLDAIRQKKKMYINFAFPRRKALVKTLEK